jgi:hypothetical protein
LLAECEFGKGHVFREAGLMECRTVKKCAATPDMVMCKRTEGGGLEAVATVEYKSRTQFVPFKKSTHLSAAGPDCPGW